METLIQLAMILMALFIILLVLVQRGRGGGLAGALGGPGGSSAFGAKAGDTFTRITIYTVAIWIALCLGASYWANHRGDALDAGETDLVTPPAGESISAAESDADSTPPAESAPADDAASSEADSDAANE